MYRIEPKETNHDFEKQNLVTKRGTKGGYDVLQFPNKKMKGEDGKTIHDTEKPIKLMEVLIENS